jgi:hypothetical protein
MPIESNVEQFMKNEQKICDSKWPNVRYTLCSCVVNLMNITNSLSQERRSPGRVRSSVSHWQLRSADEAVWFAIRCVQHAAVLNRDRHPLRYFSTTRNLLRVPDIVTLRKGHAPVLNRDRHPLRYFSTTRVPDIATLRKEHVRLVRSPI